MRIGGRDFSLAVVARIQAVIDSEPGITRRALSLRVCEWLSWYAPNGKPQDVSCRKAFLRLHREGLIRLPPARRAAFARNRRADVGLGERKRRADIEFGERKRRADIEPGEVCEGDASGELSALSEAGVPRTLGAPSEAGVPRPLGAPRTLSAPGAPGEAGVPRALGEPGEARAPGVPVEAGASRAPVEAVELPRITCGLDELGPIRVEPVTSRYARA